MVDCPSSNVWEGVALCHDGKCSHEEYDWGWNPCHTSEQLVLLLSKQVPGHPDAAVVFVFILLLFQLTLLFGFLHLTVGWKKWSVICVSSCSVILFIHIIFGSPVIDIIHFIFIRSFHAWSFFILLQLLLLLWLWLQCPTWGLSFIISGSPATASTKWTKWQNPPMPS